MEDKIKRFLTVETGSGSGYGNGSGYGYGDGNGSGYGYGDGYGNGYGDGYGNGYGSGYGYGDGSGSGYGSGYGCGDSDGDIKDFDGEKVYYIDGVPTIIKSVIDSYAKGEILNKDFELEPCYIAKFKDCFAHAATLKGAVKEAHDKWLSTLNTDEAISAFFESFNDKSKKYPAKDFYRWHNILTGSCEMGRNSYIKSLGVNLENDLFTIDEFIKISLNGSFGKSVIEELKERWECTKNEKNDLPYS